MATAVDAAIVEIQAALAEIDPIFEGMQDYARLNLHPDTMELVKSTIQFYENRRNLLVISLQSLQNLVADGYPGLPVQEVTGGIFRDLQDNADTIEAALKKFAQMQEAQGLEAREIKDLPK